METNKERFVTFIRGGAHVGTFPIKEASFHEDRVEKARKKGIKFDAYFLHSKGTYGNITTCMCADGITTYKYDPKLKKRL